MHYIIPFLTGYFASVIGTLLPGILNATVVKISKENGVKHAYSFMLGTFVIIALQTYLAVFFAKVIDKSLFISTILREIGFVVFFILTLYFLIINPKPKLNKELKIKGKRKRFYQGIVFALLNVFPVFYYVFISVTALNNKWYEMNYLTNLLLTSGVLLGAFTAFKFYIYIFRNSVVADNFVLKNINKIIGCITGTVTLINLFKILK